MDQLNAEQRATFQKYKKLYKLKDIVGYDVKQLKEFSEAKINKIIHKYLEICHQKESTSINLLDSDEESDTEELLKEIKIDCYGKPFLFDKQTTYFNKKRKL